jgi:ribonuclease J
MLHTGDFKMDQLPLDGRLTDLRAFARLGRRGSTSSSPTRPTPRCPASPLRAGHLPAIDKVFRHAERRIIVACFSSHVHRVQQVLDAAEKAGRKVAFVGRSMVRNMGIAADLGYLKVPDGVLVDAKQLEDLPDDRVVLISAPGSQGEPMAALSRMANRDHQIEVGPGDTVLLASSLIPGNENAVYRVINGLMRLGANVVHKGNAQGARLRPRRGGELLYCYNIVRPRNVMPVHGEWRHLVANAELAVATGVPRERWSLAEDGVVVDLVDGVARSSAPCPAATSTSTARVGGPTRPCSRTAGSCATRASSRCIVVIDSMPPARSRPARRSPPAASSRTT